MERRGRQNPGCATVGRALRSVLHERKNYWRNASQEHPATSQPLRERASEGPGWQLGGQEMSMEFKGGAVAVVEVESDSG